jgi:tetratricopeptide (TPR) repeat protein
MRVRGLEILGGALLLGLIGGPAEGGSVCLDPIGHLVSIQGKVEVQEAQRPDWRAAQLDEPLCVGDEIRVGPFGRAEAALINQPKFRIDQNTRVRLVRIPADQPSLIRVLEGAVYFFSRRPRVLEIDTPFVNAMVEGTEFLIRVDTGATLVTVLEGRVAARNDRGELRLAAGQSALAEAGRAPVPHVLVRPRDAVQWALYYPPILLALADRSGAAPADLAEPLRTAVAHAGAGDPARAFAAFETVPAAERGPEFHLYRAAALLGVGRVEEARADIDRTLGQDPTSGLAYGLRAVIAVARNERDQALDDARRAVDLSPRSAAARIALSYAQQARFELDEARRTLEQAVADEPRNALAHARLAELWLMLGDRRRAVRAAKKGRELAPELERVQTVLGFARLAAIDTERAKRAFRRAIALDSASPLPRFGLGLARIRRGDLAEGRGDIEIAVALDPDNALLRSYLGKAYFEERTTDPVAYIRQWFEEFPNQENTLAAEQFAIAQRLDPNDPTSYFYDAIRKQSENRPVEALRDLEKSIELNDNRAVYRSRQLLDSDRAGRGASLARIYNDLGFAQLGINEATKSLSIDPSNASAHRFLSDVYATQPRREIARVSELLQAQLLQDININPVQPSLSETNLNIFTGGGPARPGFNEFTPLFERNQAQLNVAGQVGNHYTRAGETVVSGIYDRTSVSSGYFHYETDGFRENFDLRHDIGNFFLQTAITPELNVQGEFIERRTEHGDRFLRFNPKNSTDELRRDVDQDIARVGVRYSPRIGSEGLSPWVRGYEMW